MSLGGPGGGNASGPGEGGFGGGVGFGGPSGDYGGSSGPDLTGLINADLDSFFGDVDAANASLQGGNNAQSIIGKIAATAAGILGFLATGSIGVSLAVASLVSKGFSKVQAESMVSSVKAGKNPTDIVNGLTGDGTIAKVVNQQLQAKTQKSADPQSDDFWQEFVNEWQSAKTNIKINDQFRKEALNPAFKTYQQRMAGLSKESTFKPITVGMGDFSTSFMPKRATQNAGDILNSQLAQTDVMQPKKADMDYLSQLMGVAQFQQELKNKINLAKIGNQQPDDQGTWLDAIGDIMKVGSAGADIYDKLFG